MDIELYDCPHCRTSGVLPTGEGLCPNCKKEIDLSKDKHVEESMTAEKTPIEAEEKAMVEILVKCKNHQGIGAVDRCSECMGDFCADCLIEISGERYCRRCGAMMIQEDTTIACKEASDALKFALVGVLIIGIVLEPIAIAKAVRAKKMINSDRRLTGSGKANAALAIAIIYLVMITLFFYLMFFNMPR
jgi:hypothetical protein